MNKITNQVVVITGGTQGIGKALANLFLSKGNTVVVLARHVEENEKTAFCCDVTDYGQVENTFEKIFAVHKKVDLLINNVGAGLGGAIEFLPYDRIDGQIKTNLMGAVYCTKACLTRTPPTAPMRIVNISSIGAFGVQPFRTMYSVAKSALIMFTVGMRQELYNTPVSVCAIALGDTQTDFGIHHPNFFTSSPRYGDRITRSDETSADRSDPDKKDKRMPVKNAALGIYKVACKKRVSTVYCIGAKYKFLHLISRFFTTSQISEIVRRMFEK